MPRHAPDLPPPPLTPPPDERWEYSLQVPCDPRAPGIVRHTLRCVLSKHELPALLDTVELLTSELVTNAVRHSTNSVLVLIRKVEEALRISVWDSDPTLPAPLAHSPHETFGRGLYLVRQLADDWGHYTMRSRTGCSDAGSKVVWFACATPDAPDRGAPGGTAAKV